MFTAMGHSLPYPLFLGGPSLSPDFICAHKPSTVGTHSHEPQLQKAQTNFNCINTLFCWQLDSQVEDTRGGEVGQA